MYAWRGLKPSDIVAALRAINRERVTPNKDAASEAAASKPKSANERGA